MKILCLPYSHTLSHISRPLLIANQLRARGHDVLFAGDSPRQKFIEDEGFDVLPLYQIKPEVLFGRIHAGQLNFVEDEELDLMIKSDCELFDQVQPDLIISDGRFSAPISTSIADIKHAAIVNASSTEYRAMPYIPFFDWVPQSLAAHGSILRKCLDSINLTIEMQVFNRASPIFQKYNHRFGLTKPVNATNCLTGKDLTLLADTQEYFPTRRLPANYHYIGPLTWKSSLPIPNWWPPLKNGRLLVYFTMGTTWMGGSFTALYELIRKHQITAIIATGGQSSQHEIKDLATIEGEVYVEDFIDGDLVIKESDVVVCHGGNGTIYQALQHGKPVVGIPTIPDQAFNMRRVKDLGVGERVTMKKLQHAPEKLFQIIQQVVTSPSYTQKAEDLKLFLKKLKPAERAADLIEEYFCND